MPLNSNDSMRCLRRNQNQNKSHLPKYSSLPELQLVMKEYHCRQCGFTNPYTDPICLWCTWTCEEAQHEFTSSVPRARRASAPPRVFIKIDLSPWKLTLLARNHANIDLSQPETPSKRTESSIIDPASIVSSRSSYMPVYQTFDATAVDLLRDHIDEIDMNHSYRQRDPVTAIPKSLAAITHSSSTNVLSFPQSTTEVENTPEQHDSAMGLSLSRETFNIGHADKMPAFHSGKTHERATKVSLGHDHEPMPLPTKSTHSHSPKPRPLRRKNHLHVMPRPPDADASEPIAISLTLHHSSPPTAPHLGKKSSQRPTHPHTGVHSQSSAASVSSGSGVTPPVISTYQQRSPPSPKMSPDSSPVRLGHPSRPYYTAIRKNGISPPTPSRSRPQSQPPPSSFHLGFDLTPAVASTASASRHLSMSAMLPIPPAFSALYDSDDNDINDYEVHSGPTNSARLSLSSSLHRVSYDNHTQTHAHDTRSLSRAAKGITSSRSNGVGFSMSGETELKMALATSSPSGVATTFGRKTTAADGFRFRETAIPSENMDNNNHSNAHANMGSDYLHTRYAGSKDSFMGRVKKLRNGLKEMLLN